MKRTIREVESQPFQFCPECGGEISDGPECYRCEGTGRVEPYNPTLPSYALRVYLTEQHTDDPRNWRVRSTVKRIEPEIQV